MEGARQVEVRPIDDESSLRYLGWVLANKRRVDEATDGRVGYLHLPDMGSDGIREFIKWYYPQIRKEGLVVDVRSNGGGNVSPDGHRTGFRASCWAPASPAPARSPRPTRTRSSTVTWSAC